MAINGIDTSAAASVAKSSGSSNSSSLVDSDMFLQLLVTQMQYQDPLEPMDNTEYVSQLAQLSEMEAMNNLNSSYSQSQAMSLVGQYVLLNSTDSAGNSVQVGGCVQCVTISNGQAVLCVNDNYYSMDSLDSVVDLDYIQYLSNANEEASSGDSNASGESSGDASGEGGVTVE